MRVSRPMRSAVARGPIAWLSPTLHAWSMSSAVAVPLSTIRMASKMNGTSRRLTMKPGVSLTRTVRRSMESQNAIAASVAASEVLSEEMTSTRRRMVGGLKKWRPMTLAGRSEAAARVLREREEVLLARMGCADLSDTAAHDSAPHDADQLDRHSLPPWYGTRKRPRRPRPGAVVRRCSIPCLRRLPVIRVSPGNGNDLAPPRPNVDLPRPRDLLLRVLDHLPPLRQPPPRGGGGGQHPEHLPPKAPRPTDYMLL